MDHQIGIVLEQVLCHQGNHLGADGNEFALGVFPQSGVMELNSRIEFFQGNFALDVTQRFHDTGIQAVVVTQAFRQMIYGRKGSNAFQSLHSRQNQSAVTGIEVLGNGVHGAGFPDFTQSLQHFFQ